jgi:hypothetical protein
MHDHPQSVPQDVIVLLQAWNRCDEDALTKLAPLIYAEVLNVSPHTIVRDWTLAEAWLQREISGVNPA